VLRHSNTTGSLPRASGYMNSRHYRGTRLMVCLGKGRDRGHIITQTDAPNLVPARVSVCHGQPGI